MRKTIINIFLAALFCISILFNINSVYKITFGIEYVIMFIIIIFIIVAISIIFPEYFKELYEEMAEYSNTRYIDGERESFDILTKTTKKAKEVIRSSRFFPYSVMRAVNYTSVIVARVYGHDGKPPLRAYYRIIAVNNKDKYEDVVYFLTQFRGQNFFLTLTNHQNDFELVIVDETDALVLFYKSQKIIASALHVKGKEIVREFIGIYESLRQKDVIKEYDLREINDSNIETHLHDIRQLFLQYCKSCD